MHARRVAALLAGALLMSAPARGADFSAQLDRRWDYAKPEVSEARFREALRQYPASSREALEIATQIARAQGLQRKFDAAHATLDKIEADIVRVDARVRIRGLLERGRLFNSSGSPAKAVPLFREAAEVATRAGRPGDAFYEVDALHMLGIAAPLFTHMDLAGVLDRILKDSPFAPWFKASKVIDRLGCTMSLRPAIWEPARGRVICCGDSAAFAETAIKGALGCGYKAALASKTALEGGDGNRQYNAFWQQAFYFHSRHYLGFSKETYPVARVLSDGEVDLLYRWIHDHNLCGLPGDLLSDNLGLLRAELPSIAEKITA